MADKNKGITPEDAAKLSEITKEQFELKKKMGDLNAEEIAYLEKKFELENKSRKSLEEQIAILDHQQGVYEGLGKSYDARVMQSELALEKEKLILKQLQEQFRNAEQLSEEDLEALRLAEEKLKVLEHQHKVLTNQTEVIKEGRAAAVELGEALGGALNQYGEHQFFNVKNMGKLVSAFRAGDKSLVPFIKSMGAAAIGGFINGLIQLIFQVDEAEAAFKKSAGASDEMARSMTKNWEETRKYGVELKEMTATMTDLKSTYTDFTMLNTEAQNEVSKTGALLAEVGYKSGDFAKGMQISTKALGQTAESAAAVQRDLADFANVIGVIPEQMGSDFAEMGGSLAKMGDQGIRAFKDLAIVSKTTGLEMKKILAITDKFDTFEGAAEQAGKLNAALGGNFVNAMDLMMATDPAERFGMIRDSILDTGLTFDDMSYYQRKFYTDALGLSDVSDLAAVLSGDMSNLEGSTMKSSAEYEKLAQRTKDIQSITEQFKNLMADMIPVMTEVIDDIQKWFDSLKPEDIESMKEGFKDFAAALVWVGEAFVFVIKHWYIFLPLLALLKFGPAIAGLLGMAKGVLGLGKSAEKTSKTVAEGLGEGMASVIEKTSDSMATGIENVGEKASKSKDGILALGAAILMIGGGIYFAATGFAELAASLSLLDGPQLITFTVALVLFGIGLMALISSLAALSASGVGWVGVALLLAMGAAIMMIGVGINLMMKGMAVLVGAFTGLFEAIEVEKLLFFTGFITTLGLMAPMLALAAVAMGVLTNAFIGMGIAMLLFPEDELELFTEFFGSLAAINIAHILGIAAGIGAINTQLARMPAKKMTKLESLLTMAATKEAVSAISSVADAAAGAVKGLLGAGDDKQAIKVKVDVGDVLLDGDKVGKFVKKTMGEVARDGARGTA